MAEKPGRPRFDKESSRSVIANARMTPQNKLLLDMQLKADNLKLGDFLEKYAKGEIKIK